MLYHVVGGWVSVMVTGLGPKPIAGAGCDADFLFDTGCGDHGEPCLFCFHWLKVAIV